MKIDATTSIYAAQRYRMIANKTAIQAMETPGGNDHIDISSDAVSFANVFNTAKIELEKTEDKSMRVSEIKEKIANGGFAAEPEKIADSILMYI